VFGFTIVGWLEQVFFFLSVFLGYALLSALRNLDPSKELLEREIGSIQELLDEEPNKKCMR